MNKLIHALLSLLKTVAVFCLWCLLTVFITLGISRLQKEYYAPTDTPNPNFKVAVQTGDGEYYIPKNWQSFMDSHNPPYANSDKKCTEDCLKKLDNGNYQYINEGALQTEYSEYQIKDNTVIPVSFEQYNFGHFVIAMFLAFLMLSFLKYLHAIYKIRKDKTAFITYHKKLARQLLVFVAIVVPVWGLIWWGGK